MGRRRGFTLVELLVAMALIMFIMALLSQAFIIASASFRKLKGMGDWPNGCAPPAASCTPISAPTTLTATSG